MKDKSRLRKTIRTLLFPPMWLALPVMLAGFTLVGWVLAFDDQHDALAYGSYALSAWALTLAVARVVRTVRRIRAGEQPLPARTLVGRAAASPVGVRIRSDRAYRQELSLYAGLSVNLLYTLMKAAAGLKYHSLWFGALAVYYLMLTLMRFTLARQIGRSAAGAERRAEWRRYRLCGSLLLVMDQALMVVVALVVRQDYAFHYPGHLVYAMAAYAFYALTMAIINNTRRREKESPAIAAAKVLSLVSAMVSMLSLETAMLARFSDREEDVFRRIMLGGSGAVVCLAVLALAIYMLIRSRHALRGDARTKQDGGEDASPTIVST